MAEAGQQHHTSPPVSDDDDDDIYSDCLVSLDGSVTILPGALRQLRPRSPRTRGLRHRPTSKRQAPQPPTRPPLTPTPAPAPAPPPSSTPPTAPTTATPPVPLSLAAPTAAASTTLAPSPSPAPTATPSPDTTPTPSQSTTPTPSLSTTPTPSPAPTPTPSPAPTPTPTPASAPTSTPMTTTTVQLVLRSEDEAVPCPPLQPVSAAPSAPQRTDASVCAARNMMIRLIDDDSDSESHLSDSFEDHLVFPLRPPPKPSPSPSLPPLPTTPPRPAPAVTPLPVLPQVGVGVGGSGGVVATRGRARRLMHSTSDPGVPRPPPPRPRPHLHHTRPPPMLATPLHQVEEEDTGAGVGVGVGAGTRLGAGVGVSRSDSSVTVATIHEELLVTPGIPLRVTLTNLTVITLVTAFALPHTSLCLYTAFRLVFGTLFPAYYSYKAVKTKNVKEYVKWMMYWIVFAFFTCFETLTDLFLSFWFPFYYELKILVVLWLLSPATRGSSILYRKFVHPWLARREEDIDQCIAQARQQGYSTVVQLGTKGVNYATTVLMQTAIKGGGGLMNQLRRSYSQSELVGDTGDMNRNVKALPPHMNGDHYASDYALDHHALPPGTPQHQPLSPQPSQHLTQGMLQLTPHSLPTSQIHTTSHPHTQASSSLQFQAHPQDKLDLLHQQLSAPIDHQALLRGSLQHQVHSPDTLVLQQHITSPQSGTQASPDTLVLQQHITSPHTGTQAVVTSYSQPAILQDQTDSPYAPIRYTLSLGTPQGQIVTPATLQECTATEEEPYTPPLTRQRARLQQTSLE